MYRTTNTEAVVRLSDGANIPADPGNRDFQEYLAWMVAGNTPEPVPAPSFDAILADYDARVEARLDGFAKSRRYKHIVSLCSYATSKNPTYAAEGQCGVDLRDATYEKCNELLKQCIATQTIPTWEWVEAQLPPLRWPDEAA